MEFGKALSQTRESAMATDRLAGLEWRVSRIERYLKVELEEFDRAQAGPTAPVVAIAPELSITEPPIAEDRETGWVDPLPLPLPAIEEPVRHEPSPAFEVESVPAPARNPHLPPPLPNIPVV